MTGLHGGVRVNGDEDLVTSTAPTGTTELIAPVELATRQLQAIDSFNRARRMAVSAAASAQGSREMRLDAARRLDVMRRQHDAVVATTDDALRSSRDTLRRAGTIRTIVVNRNTWFTRKLTSALLDQGFLVLAQLDNGADAVGTVVAEQPDLLLMEDPLPMMTAEQVVREVRRYSPATFVAVQADSHGTAALLEAGASTVFTRQVTPADVARNLAGVFTTTGASAS